MKRVHKKMRDMLVLSLCAAPAIGMAAEDLSYGYVELDYINLDIDQPGERLRYGDWNDGDGMGISASIPLSDVFFIYGDYSETDADFSFRDNTDAFVPGRTDLHRLNLGVGFIMPMNNTTDLVFSGGYSDIDYNRFRLGVSGDATVNNFRDDPSDGYTVDGRLRSQLTQRVEGSLGVRYTDIGGFDGLSVIGNVMYEFTPNWGLNVSLDAGDDLMTWAAGLRYSF